VGYDYPGRKTRNVAIWTAWRNRQREPFHSSWRFAVSNPNKAKGSRWEADVRDYLTGQLGVRVERIPAGAAADRGDLSGLNGLCVECKNVARLDFAGWVDEATTEARNVNADTLPVVIAKRRNKSVEHGYVVMPVWAWAELLTRHNSSG
jgi:hypothetical protein